MDNNYDINFDTLVNNPNFDFLKTLLINSNDPFDVNFSHDYDFDDSPYAEMVSSSTYVDESDLCSKFKNNFNANNLSVMSLNIQSINAKFNSLSEFIFSLNNNSCTPDIICLQELWQFPNNMSFYLSGYHPLQYKLRRHNQGGGVGIFIKDTFKFTVLPEKSIFVDRVYESIFTKIELSTNNYVIVGSCYRPGTKHPSFTVNEQFSQFSELLSNQLNDILSLEKPVYVFGDFNLDVLRYGKCSQVTEYIDFLFSVGMLQVITKPTRLSKNSASIIDHMLTNSPSYSDESLIVLSDISDHFPIFSFIKGKCKTSIPLTFEMRDFSQANLNR
jgi:endonuclease/exonuclease/phosphatase family metal-dependent hydrolase